MHEILSGYDSSVATQYILEEHPHLIERVLKYSRLDVLPLDVAAGDFGDFTEKYTFFKCDVQARDDAVVRNGQLSFTAYSYAALYIPPLNFGSLREMTVSFYFSIDNLGEDKNVEKRFGFRLGEIEVYFVPETDLTDIGQFRRCYTRVGGVGEPQSEYLDEAAFLEGEMMRVVFQIHQDHMSTMHLCKTSSEKVFEKTLELNRLGFCNAASRATDFLGIFADGSDCEKCAWRSLTLIIIFLSTSRHVCQGLYCRKPVALAVRRRSSQQPGTIQLMWHLVPAQHRAEAIVCCLPLAQLGSSLGTYWHQLVNLPCLRCGRI
ncbi:yki [Symbiodinium pilosum]|uniref:Yki protein n=1 Tax=Symbiodinium pilosum TaxID=2952 RepID=A0A812JWB0_SYMPI|nr:yki [Symbiodinium pilosum]